MTLWIYTINLQDTILAGCDKSRMQRSNPPNSLSWGSSNRIFNQMRGLINPCSVISVSKRRRERAV